MVVVSAFPENKARIFVYGKVVCIQFQQHVDGVVVDYKQPSVVD